MKLLTPIFILICATVGFGQPIKEKIAKFDDHSRFTYSFDKFKNETTIGTTVKFHEPKEKLELLECSIFFTFTGQTIDANIQSFLLVFHPIGSTEWQFLRSHHLIFLLDGQKLDVGDGEHDGTVVRGGVNEYVLFTVPRETVEKMALAKSVEIQLGSFEEIISPKSQPRIKTILDLAGDPLNPCGDCR